MKTPTPRPQRYGPRGGGLIPDSAFHERRGPSHPTAERCYAPENDAPERDKLALGCYHKRPVREP